MDVLALVTSSRPKASHEWEHECIILDLVGDITGGKTEVAPSGSPVMLRPTWFPILLEPNHTHCTATSRHETSIM